MHVRLARPTDAPLVFALALDDNAHLVRSPDWPQANRVARTLARAAMPLAMPARCWVASNGSSTALLETHGRQYVIGWDVARLAVRGDPSTTLVPLIAAATEHLQGRGVPRLFARPRSDGREHLSQAGFQTLAQEYALVGPTTRPQRQGVLPLGSRYRLPQDAWALHQLESEIAPPLVRQLEGLTSWDWNQRDRADMTQVIVERDGRIVAWTGWQPKARRGLNRLGILVHPEHSELAEALLNHVLQELPPGSRFLTRVRQYQSQTLRACFEAGFEIVSEETLMVKHAGVELARAEKSVLRVGRVPGVPAFHTHIGEVPGTIASGAVIQESRAQ